MSSTMSASIAYVNARVFTGDPRRPWADALLVDGESIAVVGSSAEVRKRAGGGTRTIDLRGMMMVPGFMLSKDTRVLEAVRHCPIDAPSTSFREDESAALVRDKFANFVIVDRDITAMKPEEIAEVKIVAIVVGGRTIHAADPAFIP